MGQRVHDQAAIRDRRLLRAIGAPDSRTGMQRPVGGRLVRREHQHRVNRKMLRQLHAGRHVAGHGDDERWVGGRCIGFAITGHVRYERDMRGRGSNDLDHHPQSPPGKGD